MVHELTREEETPTHSVCGTLAVLLLWSLRGRGQEVVPGGPSVGLALELEKELPWGVSSRGSWWFSSPLDLQEKRSLPAPGVSGCPVTGGHCEGQKELVRE
jgi:hypothetical protein